MQFFILLVGIMVFVFYQFNETPLNFNPKATTLVENSEYADDYKALELKKDKLYEYKKNLIHTYTEAPSESLKKEIGSLANDDKELRKQGREILKASAQAQNIKFESNDKDYVFIYFILNNLPRGLIGLLLAVILSAAMSSTASELNALGTTTTMDLYKRNVNGEKSEKHFVLASKYFTLLWGIIAILVASIANLFENLIQLVNIIGSLFYGNVLGIFFLAFFIRYVRGNAVFMAAIITQILVLLLYYFAIYQFESVGEKPYFSFLWLNLIGCGIVMIIAIILQTIRPNRLVSSSRE